MVHNGVITAPVSISDPMTALGENTADLATLCTSANINRWAKFKPEAIGGFAEITEQQRKDNNYGLTPPQFFTNKTALISGLKAGTGTWGYTRPSTVGWMRITDFIGYDHNAVPPFGSIKEQDVLLSSGPVIPTVLPVITTGSLSLADFAKYGEDFQSWYFSVLMTNSNGDWLASTDKTFAQGSSWEVDFSGSTGLKTGEYTAIPFISSHRWIPGTADPAVMKACGLGVKGVTIHLITEQDRYTVSIAATWNTAQTTVSYTVSIYNGGDYGAAFQNVTLRAAKDINGTGAIELKRLGDINVAKGQTWTNESAIRLSSEYQYLGLSYTGLSEITWHGIHLPITPVDPNV